MASGLAALLDDIAAIARLAAASLDDVAASAGKASSKAAGVVIDDAAVTPRYVTGFSPERELPIIGRIALGSLRNKLLILLPGALLLSAFAPWLITPLLMLGGAFLCYEGAEKFIEAVSGHGHGEAEEAPTGDPFTMEKEKIAGAIRTDLILSAEIMAIALADVAARPIVTQASVLVVVGLLVTVGVYGAVALIVKMDDVGLHLARRGGAGAPLGRGLVHAMPHVLAGLSTIGMAAMLWVGGGIVLHGLEELHIAKALPHAIHHVAALAGGGAIGWIVNAALAGVAGLVLGLAIVGVHHAVAAARR
jgi:hypothetical protein